MGSDGSVAPKERVNITYKSATGDAQEEKELPFRVMVLGDFTQKADDTPLEDRKPVSVNKDNFDAVMKEHGVSLSFSVPNRLSEDEEAGELPVELKVGGLRDLEPEQVARQVPALAELLEMREALAALKGPLSSVPNFRRKLMTILKDENRFQQVLGELGLSDDEE